MQQRLLLQQLSAAASAAFCVGACEAHWRQHHRGQPPLYTQGRQPSSPACALRCQTQQPRPRYATPPAQPSPAHLSVAPQKVSRRSMRVVLPWSTCAAGRGHTAQMQGRVNTGSVARAASGMPEVPACSPPHAASMGRRQRITYDGKVAEQRGVGGGDRGAGRHVPPRLCRRRRRLNRWHPARCAALQRPEAP